MCGIFGISLTKESAVKQHYREIASTLFLLSESRGKEASGFAIHTGKELRYLKSPFPASDLVNSAVFKNEVDRLINSGNSFFTTIGHSRLVTNGYEQYNENNQPVIKNNLAVIHNGIIVNDAELWKKYSDEEKLSGLDSEVIPTLIRRFLNQGDTLQTALSNLYKEIYGMTSIAVLPFENKNLILATNNGSLYYVSSEDKSAFVFASERFILNSLIEKLKLASVFSKQNIKQLPTNFACSVNIETNAVHVRGLTNISTDFNNLTVSSEVLLPVEITEKVSDKAVYINTSMEHRATTVPKVFTDEVNSRNLRIASLKRCTKCILPETFPFIEYDSKGVCNYCNNYQPLKFKGAENFKLLLDSYRSKDGSPDCLMPFSGGRDSSFALHYVKKELGMNPIAFSYDWGMLTDLARRNQARMCGKLGVEHILVSADIRKKRDNIRKNVTAWLKRPNLGTIPLFMAGDKQYFYFANLLMEQNKLDLSILGENMLETTRFKTGFCGIKPTFDGDRTYSISLSDKLKMLFFYGKEYVLNPAYINSSLLDTLDSFKSYYVIKHRNINIFDYLPWEEEPLEKILIEEYDWETDPGTKTTWRIGDGTAAFYNYIYFVVAGFTENDTFRSNQIREGSLTRKKALEKTITENQPRWDSVQWYCNTINVDFESTIKTINKIKTLY
ncbi:MAG: Amidophosphoribosyltransferase [Bacteroidia bacterium]|nr:Amidophosphoribosyltransferase [Bacteroidia bacterium]